MVDVLKGISIELLRKAGIFVIGPIYTGVSYMNNIKTGLAIYRLGLLIRPCI